jgi:hypothetical protein
MGFSIGGALGDLAGAAVDFVEAGAHLGSEAMSFASFANPTALLTKTGFDLTGQILKDIFEQGECVRGHRKQGRGEKGGCHGGSGADGAEGGGSIFEQVALALGEAMDNKLQDLLKAANEVANLSGGQGDQGKLLTASAQVTARGQELNAISQSANSAINSLGNAVSTAASKR